MAKKYLVTAFWDDEADVWVATSDDIPGLVTEATTLDKLRERVIEIAPDLLEENAHLLPDDDGFGDLVNLCVESSFRNERHHAL